MFSFPFDKGNNLRKGIKQDIILAVSKGLESDILK
jgi:hypothetical protein